MSEVTNKVEAVQVEALDEMLRLLRDGDTTQEGNRRMKNVTAALNTANNTIRNIHVGRSLVLRAIHELDAAERRQYLTRAVPELKSLPQGKTKSKK